MCVRMLSQLLLRDAHEGDGVMRGMLRMGVVRGRGVGVRGRGGGGRGMGLRLRLARLLHATRHPDAYANAAPLLRGRAVVLVRGGVRVLRVRVLCVVGLVGLVGLGDVLQRLVGVLVRRVLVGRVGVRVLGVHGDGGLLVTVRGARRVVVVLRNGIDGHLLSHHPHHLRLVGLR